MESRRLQVTVFETRPLVGRVGLEPTTTRLKVEGSTTELPALRESGRRCRDQPTRGQSKPAKRHGRTRGRSRKAAILLNDPFGGESASLPEARSDDQAPRWVSCGRPARLDGAVRRARPGLASARAPPGRDRDPRPRRNGQSANAVSAPLHDLNIMREGIPSVLTRAVVRSLRAADAAHLRAAGAGYRGAERRPRRGFQRGRARRSRPA